MEKIITKEVLERLRQKYPVETRVCLISMKNPYRNVKSGTLGTVQGVDEKGDIHVAWDDGKSFRVVYGEDKCEKLTCISCSNSFCDTKNQTLCCKKKDGEVVEEYSCCAEWD